MNIVQKRIIILFISLVILMIRLQGIINILFKNLYIRMNTFQGKRIISVTIKQMTNYIAINFDCF